jgi:hypothetical protein
MRKACSNDEKSTKDERQGVRIPGTCDSRSRPIPSCSEMGKVLGCPAYPNVLFRDLIGPPDALHVFRLCTQILTAAQYIQSAAFTCAFRRRSCTNHV